MRSAFSPPASPSASLPNPATRRPSRITGGGGACGAPGRIHRATESTACGAPECAGEMAVV
ncbi:hypothetical protein [Streptomyces sp. NPDC002328]|uniref:hypothetical protein n=1 Tax=Streptomyces sp. NPDC002328 TaxID=3364642 RepID=UPI00367D8DBC